MNYLDEIIKDEYQKLSVQEYKLNKQLGIEIVKNGYVLPANRYCNPNNTLLGSGGVLNSDKKYIEISAMKGYNMSDRLSGKYSFNDHKVQYIDEKVIYLNHFINHWGHYLLDVIGRLWYILENDISEYKIVYTCKLGRNRKIKGNFLTLLNLLGIDESQLIKINKVTKFKEIIVPESSIFPGKYYTDKYVKIFDTIVKNANIELKSDNKIYCSRQQLKVAKRKEIGEEKIEKIFNDNGYKSVYLEKMPLIEQIKLINSSKEIVAISGTLPHNLIFARNNPHVVILNKTYKINIHQFLINQITTAKVDFVDINVSPLPVLYGNGPFIMKVTDNLKDYCVANNIKMNCEVNYKLTLKEKIWYYFKYLLTYKGKIINDSMIETEKIRELYKERQNQSYRKEEIK